MASNGIIDCRHCHRSSEYNTWWIHAYNMVCVIFWVDPYHNLYGGIDDTSFLGEQESEIEFGSAIRDNYIVYYSEITDITVFLSSNFY